MAFREGKMTYTKLFGWAVLAAAMAIPASAQDWRDTYHDRQDVRSDYRDMSHDYARVNGMQADIARDQTRLNEDIRCGRTNAASRDAADLARDQRAYAAQVRDIRHDQRDVSRDRRDIRSDYGDWR
jgi:hypothetical protein